MDVVQQWRDFLASEPSLTEDESAAREEALQELTLAAMADDAQTRAAVVEAFRDQSGARLRQALGSVVLPPREELAEEPARWWSHPEVRTDPAVMPVAMALSLPPASVLLEEADFRTDPLSMCTSWFAGPAARRQLDASVDAEPQRSDGQRLTHVIHVNLADESSNQGPEAFASTGLPDHGALQLFHDLSTEGWDDESDPTAWQVRWLPLADGDEVSLTDGAADSMVPLNPQVVPTVPSPLEPSLNDEEYDRYARAHAWLEELGHEMNTMAGPDGPDFDERLTPWDDSYEPLPSLTRMSGCPSAERTEETVGILTARLPLTAQNDRHVLLLDVNPENYGQDSWFHGGHNVEVWMRASDLVRRDFSSIWCLIRTDA